MWESMKSVWRDCKRKDDFSQNWHLVKCECDGKKDHNTDSLYVQAYIPEKHTQQIERSIWSAHEVTTRNSTYIQRFSVKEYQKELHQDISQRDWMTVVY
jgi:hypothetical protein